VTLQSFRHNGQGRRFIALFRDVTLRHLIFVIGGSPQIMHLAVDPDVHLVEALFPVTHTAHPVYALAVNIGCKQRTNGIPPEPHRFVTNVDPVLEQEVFQHFGGSAGNALHLL
jgi:hypothetical protein